jgi:hypothetical protein
VDERLRELQRRAETGDLRAVAAQVHARRRGGLPTPVPQVRQGVRGDALATLFRDALAAKGLSHMDVIRAAGISSRKWSHYVQRLRKILTGAQDVPWFWVQRLCPGLGLDPAVVAAATSISPPPAPVNERPNPDEAVCFNCRSMVWLVGLGQGVRCSSSASPLGHMGRVRDLGFTCERFASRDEG